MKNLKLDNKQYILIDDSQFNRLNKFNWKFNKQLNKLTTLTVKNNFYEFDKFLLRLYEPYKCNDLNIDNIIIDHIDDNILNNQFNNMNMYNISAIIKRIKNKFLFVKEYIDIVLNLFRILNYQYIALTKEQIENQCSYIEYEYNEFISYYNLINSLQFNLFDYSYINKKLINKLLTYKFIIADTLYTYQIRSYINYTYKLKKILYDIIKLKLNYVSSYIFIIEKYKFNNNELQIIIEFIKKRDKI